MSIVIRTIHGIHSAEGNNSMAHFAPCLQRAAPEASVRLFEYGFMGFWAARFENDGVAKRLAEVSLSERIGDQIEVWVTHSNGAAIAYKAVENHGAAPHMIVNINPALDRWRAANVPRVEVIHSAQDRWVDLAQLIPGHIWGDQGRAGYGSTLFRTAKRGDVVNHFASGFGYGMGYIGHLGLFHESRREKWAHFMMSRVDEFVGKRRRDALRLGRREDDPIMTM